MSDGISNRIVYLINALNWNDLYDIYAYQKGIMALLGETYGTCKAMAGLT
mgnify:CR=1 FL=1